MQQSILEHASKCFANMMKPDTFREGQTGILRFPEDELQAWKVLLYWMVHGKIPKVTIAFRDVLAIRCWQLGDKYNISGFQDDAMLSLLYTLKGSKSKFASDVIKEGITRSSEGSTLRQLCLQEAVNNSFDGTTKQLYELDCFDGLGCMSELIAHYHHKTKHDNLPQDRFLADTWKGYMLVKQNYEIHKSHWAFHEFPSRKRKAGTVYSDSDDDDT